MVGQDQEGLHQTDAEHNDQHHGHDPQDLADFAGDEGQGAEHEQGGDEGGGDAGQHLTDALDGGVHRRIAAFHARGDVLADDDGVVHEQTDADQQAHHGDHVDGDAHHGHDVERAHEGHRQAHGHPEAVPEAEEQPQHQEYGQQALGAVAQQHVETILDDGGHVLGQAQFHAARGLPAFALHEGAHRPVGVEHVLGLGLGDVEHGGAAAVEQDLGLVPFEAVADDGDFAQADAGAGLAGNDDQVAEFVHGLALIVETQQHVLVAAFQSADGRAHAVALHGGSDLGGRQAELA